MINHDNVDLDKIRAAGDALMEGDDSLMSTLPLSTNVTPEPCIVAWSSRVSISITAYVSGLYMPILYLL